MISAYLLAIVQVMPSMFHAQLHQTIVPASSLILDFAKTFYWAHKMPWRT
jgi:hypothetical protein